jgi:hypothetical protein
LALTTDQVRAIADETRRQELRTSVAAGLGKQKILEQLATQIGDTKYAVKQALDADSARLAALEVALGPGLAASVGEYSTTDQAMRAERFAGKAAAVDHVKANPGATEAEATDAYRVAALAARPAGRQWILQDPLALRQEYTANLVAYGLIPDSTWESWRAWILATPRDVILGLN